MNAAAARALVAAGAVLLAGCAQPEAAAPSPALATPAPESAAPTPAAPDPAARQPEPTPLPPEATSPDGELWLDALEVGLARQDWGTPRARRTVDDRPLTLGGVVHERGFGTHSGGELLIRAGKGVSRVRALVGVDDEVGDHGSVSFEVWADGQLVVRTPVLHGGDPPQPLDVVVEGAREIWLVTADGGDGIDYDHADWAEARLLPVAAPVPGGAAPLIVRPPEGAVLDIVLPTPPEPAIQGPLVVGGTPGRPFLHRVPATGESPLRFAAEGLPPGLRLDAETGIISGALPAPAAAATGGVTRTEVTLHVTGPRGEARRALTIVAGEHQLALTPPLGWNSWNAWGTSVDDGKVRAAAEALLSSGLAAHGFQYVNIDDAWEGPRDADGRITSNEKFPDMRALADHVHGLGLKLGIYSSPGRATCAGFPGSLGHEAQDAARYAEWGIDYLKHDWCSYGEVAPDPTPEELQAPYRVMRAALDAAGRDIVFSLCQYGMGDVWTWGEAVGGNLWRTTGDITDRWSSLADIGFRHAELAEFAGPGHWNDPDMLVVGKLGWGPELHATGLTRNEQITHITLWSMIAAPLLIGCDLTQLDDFTLALLTNDDVLAVDQDPLGIAARRTLQDGAAEVWMRPLADGTLAAAAFNRGRVWRDVSIDWSATSWEGAQPVRNLWLRRDEGRFLNRYNAGLPPHAALLLRIGEPIVPPAPPAPAPPATDPAGAR